MPNKDGDGFISFDDLDPETAGIIGQGRQRQADRRLTPAQRRRAERERTRNTRRVDLPPELENRLEKLAADLSVSFSSLVVYLLDQGLDVAKTEELEDARVISRSMRFEYLLPYQEKKK